MRVTLLHCTAHHTVHMNTLCHQLMVMRETLLHCTAHHTVHMNIVCHQLMVMRETLLHCTAHHTVTYEHLMPSINGYEGDIVALHCPPQLHMNILCHQLMVMRETLLHCTAHHTVHMNIVCHQLLETLNYSCTLASFPGFSLAFYLACGRKSRYHRRDKSKGEAWERG